MLYLRLQHGFSHLLHNFLRLDRLTQELTLGVKNWGRGILSNTLDNKKNPSRNPASSLRYLPLRRLLEDFWYLASRVTGREITRADKCDTYHHLRAPFLSRDRVCRVGSKFLDNEHARTIGVMAESTDT